MKWFRRLFARSDAAPQSPTRRTFRPEFDHLEDRRLLNVSAVFDKTGGLTTFVVDQAGALSRINKTGNHLINVRPDLPAGVTVRVAHAYLDKRGKVGVDVVYTDGQGWKADSFGTAHIADGVLNMNTAVTNTGKVKTYLLLADPMSTPPFGQNLKGTLVVRAKGVDTILDTDVRWVSTFINGDGKIGVVKGKVLANNNLFVTKAIGAKTKTLYNSPNGATQDITHYSQTFFNGQTVIDVTFGRFAGTYDLRFQKNDVFIMGDGASIKAGG